MQEFILAEYNPKRSENMTEIKPEYEIDSLDKIFKVLEEI